MPLMDRWAHCPAGSRSYVRNEPLPSSPPGPAQGTVQSLGWPPSPGAALSLLPVLASLAGPWLAPQPREITGQVSRWPAAVAKGSAQQLGGQPLGDVSSDSGFTVSQLVGTPCSLHHA